MTMSVRKELYKTTTHVVLSFIEHEQDGKPLEVELLPSSWVFNKINKWFCVYPPVEEYDRIEAWCEKRAPPKKDWEVHEVNVLSQCISPYLINVLEKGFIMMNAKMDYIRQSVLYDVKEGYKKINSSIALSGVTTYSLDELKSKLDVTLPITELNIFEAFDADLIASVDKKKDCANVQSLMTNFSCIKISSRNYKNFTASHDINFFNEYLWNKQMDFVPETQAYPDWSALPDHVLGTIFGYLKESDRYNASLVCRSWSYAFWAPETWRKFTLNISRTKKYCRKAHIKPHFDSYGLPLGLLSVVASHVHCLEIVCPWRNEDKNGSLGVSQRISSAISDLRYRGCQVRHLALRKFERLNTSWRDPKARLRIIKALKRFINGQQNLTLIDMRYSHLKLWEVTTLLSAATFRSAKSVVSIDMQDAFSYDRVPHLDWLRWNVRFHDNMQERDLYNELAPRNVIGQEEQNFVREEIRNLATNLGIIISRFSSLRNLCLILDTIVLGMDLLQCLPESLCSLKLIIRRWEMEDENFCSVLVGNSLCNNKEWKKLVGRCPQLQLDLDLRGVLWYHPLYCMLQPLVPLKRIRLFSPFEPPQLKPFLFHLIESFSTVLEEVDFCIFRSKGLDDLLLKIYQSCKYLKTLRFRGKIQKTESVHSLCWDLAQCKLSISHLALMVETSSKTFFKELSLSRHEFCKWLTEDSENIERKNTCINEHSVYRIQRNCNFQLGIMRLPLIKSTSWINLSS